MGKGSRNFRKWASPKFLEESDILLLSKNNFQCEPFLQYLKSEDEDEDEEEEEEEEEGEDDN